MAGVAHPRCCYSLELSVIHRRCCCLSTRSSEAVGRGKSRPAWRTLSLSHEVVRDAAYSLLLLLLLQLKLEYVNPFVAGERE